MIGLAPTQIGGVLYSALQLEWASMPVTIYRYCAWSGATPLGTQEVFNPQALKRPRERATCCGSRLRTDFLLRPAIGPSPLSDIRTSVKRLPSELGEITPVACQFSPFTSRAPSSIVDSDSELLMCAPAPY